MTHWSVSKAGTGRRLARLAAVGVIALCAFSVAHATETSEITRVLQPFVDRQELAGAVTLVASKDRVLSLESVGYSDVAAKRSMSTDDLFWIASMSKPITATALMMLVDEGKVTLDDIAGKQLRGFNPRIMKTTEDGSQVRLVRPQQAITVRQLLSHRSGLPFSSAFETPTLDQLPLAVRVESYALTPLNFEPGSRFAYSNAGINTAARVIEVVSGMRFEDFLQQRLFGPLGMKDTTFWPTPAQMSRLAKSYKPNAAKTSLEETQISQLHYPLTDRAHRYPMPAGGLFSTASDLAKFCQMLLNGGTFAGRRYLSESAIREMTRNQLAADQRGTSVPPEGYGLGWFTQTSGAYGHSGAYGSYMTVHPAHGLITIWMIQHAGFLGNGDKARAAFEEVAVEAYGKSARSNR